MNKIWIYWEQGWENAPTPVIECAKSWEVQNPEAQIFYLSAQNIDDYIELPPELKNIAQKLRVQTKTDIYRLALIHQNGGIWVDATLFCAKPLRDWLRLSAETPVALFHNPGADRLVSSWFIAALPQNELIKYWLDELTEFLLSLRNPASPKGLRKVILKLLRKAWSKNIRLTLNWWSAVPKNILSLTPYFIVHYCYNRLFITNAHFASLAKSTQALPAEPAHLLQMHLRKAQRPAPQEILQSPVHKMNWRKLDPLTSIQCELEKIETKSDYKKSGNKNE